MTLSLPSRRAVRCVLITLLTSGLAACAGIGQPSASDRLATAQAMFAQRCQTAGEKIYRTVDNVEGIYLLKLRPVGASYANQFALTDPYGNDVDGDGYIATFLRGSYDPDGLCVLRGLKCPFGYAFVEALDSMDGKRYHYTGRLEEPWQNDKAYLKGYIRFVMDKTLATSELPRYGVTYEDISTQEEREHWIAGSSLKVIDLQSNEVIAERLGYMMDPGQGSRGGGRAPWQMAVSHACPAFPGVHSQAQIGQTDRFVEKVLLPRIDIQPSRLE